VSQAAVAYLVNQSGSIVFYVLLSSYGRYMVAYENVFAQQVIACTPPTASV
jgi:hypothetical protein